MSLQLKEILVRALKGILWASASAIVTGAVAAAPQIISALPWKWQVFGGMVLSGLVSLQAYLAKPHRDPAAHDPALNPMANDQRVNE
jgi:hypothetical protein